MSDDAELKMVDAHRAGPDEARARRGMRSVGARVASFVGDLVDRHTRFMAFVWGPDWQLERDPAPITRTAERRG